MHGPKNKKVLRHVSILTDHHQGVGMYLVKVTELFAAAETWLDGQHSEFLFEWLVKVRATGYEMY